MIVQILINTISVLVAAYLLPGVHVATFLTAVVVAIVLGIINTVLKPILVILTLPITIATLGLFYFVINAFLILFVSAIVPGFSVNSFWSALLFSLVLSLISFLFHALAKT